MRSQSASDDRPITIELVGGLGNQLFGYFAGLYIAKNLGVRLRPYIRPSAKGEAKHASSIKSFVLPVKIYGPSSLNLRLERFARLFVARAKQKLGLLRSDSESSQMVHRAESLGNDHNLKLIRPGCYVQGYFQTAEYFQALKLEGADTTLVLRRPSAWFQKTQVELEHIKPLVVHVRRGDYVQEKNRPIGALSSRYFLEAIKSAQGHRDFGTKEIWVFSDDISQVMPEFEQSGIKVDQWIQPPENVDPSESLVLMSKTDAIVVSNSTFSWWSAVLGSPKVVVCPSEWFQSLPEPEGLIPSDWIRVDSSWK